MKAAEIDGRTPWISRAARNPHCRVRDEDWPGRLAKPFRDLWQRHIATWGGIGAGNNLDLTVGAPGLVVTLVLDPRGASTRTAASRRWFAPSFRNGSWWSGANEKNGFMARVSLAVYPEKLERRRVVQLGDGQLTVVP